MSDHGAVSFASVCSPDDAGVGRQCPIAARFVLDHLMTREYHGDDNGDYGYDALFSIDATSDCEA